MTIFMPTDPLVALMVLVSLTLTGLITPEDAFSGFASTVVITVLVTSIAIDAAFRLGADPRSFVIGVVLASTSSQITRA